MLPSLLVRRRSEGRLAAILAIRFCILPSLLIQLAIVEVTGKGKEGIHVCEESQGKTRAQDRLKV